MKLLLAWFFGWLILPNRIQNFQAASDSFKPISACIGPSLTFTNNLPGISGDTFWLKYFCLPGSKIFKQANNSTCRSMSWLQYFAHPNLKLAGPPHFYLTLLDIFSPLQYWLVLVLILCRPGSKQFLIEYFAHPGPKFSSRPWSPCLFENFPIISQG